jgi:DNA repair protein RadC
MVPLVFVICSVYYSCMTPLTLLPIQRKPRELLQENGAQSLSLEELIALVIGSGSAGNEVMYMSSLVAQKLLEGNCTMAQLVRIPGIGVAKACEILASMELSMAVTRRSIPSVLADPSSVYLSCNNLLELPQEHLVVFFLTVRNQEIARETVSIGTATASLIHPREVFRPAIIHNASHIVLAHNHPSGVSTPSNADRQATARISQAGTQVGIELIDHVICATQGFTSMKTVAPELFF